MTVSPTTIEAHTKSKCLDIGFDDGQSFTLSFEYLRVYSPSAEVKGHGPGQEILQTGKRNVGLLGIEPVGHYAIRLLFDDGHQTGIYTWEYLYQLGQAATQNWQAYLQRLADAGFDAETGRDAPMQAAQPAGGSCGSGKSCH